MKKKLSIVMFLPLLITACGGNDVRDTAFNDDIAAQDKASTFQMPVPHANNAVAIANGTDGPTLYSFNGIKAGKTYKDTSNMGFACPIKLNRCDALPALPVSNGRLASIAVTVANKVYIFGGYSVQEDGSEKSEPEVFRYNPDSNDYSQVDDMPTPVDDAVALTYQDRYIYLISGWHNEGNVNLVQIYDTQDDVWARGTDYPGAPVFGHAGGIVGNKFIIADGVEVVNDDRRYAATNEVWRGDIDVKDYTKITWSKITPHAGKPLYRMAANGQTQSNHIIFAGGSDNPYNYNGIGYNKAPSVPSDAVFAYDLAGNRWIDYTAMPAPSMDHRGLLFADGYAYIMGGMNASQRVVGDIMKFKLQPKMAQAKE